MSRKDVRYIGVDKPRTEVVAEPEMHWSEKARLGYVQPPRKEYELGDELSDHSDDQGWDKFDN